MHAQIKTRMHYSSYGMLSDGVVGMCMREVHMTFAAV